MLDTVEARLLDWTLLIRDIWQLQRITLLELSGDPSRLLLVFVDSILSIRCFYFDLLVLAAIVVLEGMNCVGIVLHAAVHFFIARSLLCDVVEETEEGAESTLSRRLWRV